MSDTDRIRSEREANVFSVVCPYLGLPDDPQTYIAWAQPAHVCFRVDQPQPIKLAHQQSYCLSLKHSYCRIFLEGWQGELPDGIRGDSNSISASQVAFSDTLLAEASDEIADQELSSRLEPPLSQEAQIVHDLRKNIVEPVDELEDEPAFWKDILNRKNLLWISLVVIILALVIAGGASGLGMVRLQRESSLTMQAISLAATGTSNAARVEAESTQAALGALAKTRTVEASIQETLSATQQTKIPSPTPSQIPSRTPTPTSTPEGDVLLGVDFVDCNVIESYTLEIIEGPIITPYQGFIYVVGATPPVVQASWILENTSGCDWSEINLYSTVNLRLLKPDLRLDGVLLSRVLEEGFILAGPGDQIEVILGFDPGTARYIDNEWAFEINGFRLLDQPRAVLEIDDWVITVLPTATTVSSGGGGGDDGDEDQVVPTQPPPDVRPTTEPPPTRP